MTQFKLLTLKSTLLPPSILLLLLLLPGLISFAVCRKSISPFEYLNLPQRDQFDGDFHRLVSKSLLRVDFDSASSMETVREALEKATHDELSEPEHREICRKILDLSRDKCDCSRSLLDIYQSAWAQMMANFGKGWGRFFTYMRVFGQRHFELCVKQVTQMGTDRLTEPNEEFERDFRELYRQTLGLAEAGDGKLFADLLAQLAKLDLVRGQIDAQQLLEAAARGMGNSTRAADDPIGMVREFMSNRCEPLLANQQLGMVLDVVGWARCLGSEVEVGQQLLLLAEYRRLCLVWTRPSTRQLVEANVQRQLPWLCNRGETTARALLEEAREDQASGQ